MMVPQKLAKMNYMNNRQLKIKLFSKNQLKKAQCINYFFNIFFFIIIANQFFYSFFTLFNFNTSKIDIDPYVQKEDLKKFA